ncbi:MAG: hypothetical protein H7334_06050 [Ferruginibacter sp.]|nr:hypothetical protein [Ferruginibacter sp.]
MKAIATAHFTFENAQSNTNTTIFDNINSWIKRQGPIWEFNRLGIAATCIFIQVTVAAIMLGIVALAGASAWLYGIGIFFTFMANSLAFAQSPMRWVLGITLASIIVNASFAIYFAIQLWM